MAKSNLNLIQTLYILSAILKYNWDTFCIKVLKWFCLSITHKNIHVHTLTHTVLFYYKPGSTAHSPLKFSRPLKLPKLKQSDLNYSLWSKAPASIQFTSDPLSLQTRDFLFLLSLHSIFCTYYFAVLQVFAYIEFILWRKVPQINYLSSEHLSCRSQSINTCCI